MLPAQTPTDPMLVNAILDLMEMVKAEATEVATVGHIISLSYVNDTGCALSLPRAVL